MPTTYAHYRLGRKVRKQINEDAARAIQKYPDLFNFGVHGPDLLFYYNALSHNPVNGYGSDLHDRPGRFFFEKAAKVVEKYGEEEAYLSYVYGFLCHFALDVTCHGYIEEMIQKTGISHAEIEAELDRELLIRDGYSPVCQKLTGHLHPSMAGANVIQSFFGPITTKQVYTAQKSMVTYLDLLVCPSKIKREILYWGLRKTGHYDSMHGLIINYRKNQKCAPCTEHLTELFEDAVKLATTMIDSFLGVARGEGELDSVFDYDFCSILHKEDN